LAGGEAIELAIDLPAKLRRSRDQIPRELISEPTLLAAIEHLDPGHEHERGN
jgi:hypothetical protein